MRKDDAMKSRMTNGTFCDNADLAERIRLRGMHVKKILTNRKANLDANGKSDENENIRDDMLNDWQRITL